MKVNNTSTVQLTPDEIQSLIIEHLKKEGVITDDEKFSFSFDAHIHHKDDYSLGGGYSTANFDGCTVVINKN